MTVFPETKLLPCYLFAFVAGAYEELKLQHTYKVLSFSYIEYPYVLVLHRIFVQTYGRTGPIHVLNHHLIHEILRIFLWLRVRIQQIRPNIRP